MTFPFVLLGTTILFLVKEAASDCLSDPVLNELFAGGADIPAEGSCCQADVCGLPCPESVSEPGIGYGIAVAVSIVISFVVGVATLFMVHGKVENFFVAGRSLPLWIVAMTLGAQCVDSNALLGNADLSYKYSFYDGFVIPLGLGLSLLLNGIFLAHKINQDNVLTLPDVIAKRYGKWIEILTSIACIISFIMLLAGNLVGMGVTTSYLWGTSETTGIWVAGAIVWAYTVSGGLFSVAYTDVVQGAMGWTGCIVTAYWFIANTDPRAPTPSIGFDGYVYPDTFGDGGACDTFSGISCTYVEGGCCYNAALWCPSEGNCTTDNGAYPFGDQNIYQDQMTNPQALTPYPNAIFWNWCTIFILAVGNLGALDFQARSMASKTPMVARMGCIIAGFFTFFVGIPFSYMGAITRIYYGPDSAYAEYEADSCSEILGLPSCGMWVPDPTAFLKLLTHQAPPAIGAWCLIGIVAASMSTADGAILAMGTVFAHNITRQLDIWWPEVITPDNLLLMTRLSTIPFTIASACIGSFYRSTSSSNATGYLLVVAFDVVLATVVPILIAAFYVKNPSPRAAFLSVLTGAICRVVLEFALPKDGYLLLPFQYDEFLNYGVVPSDKLPLFFDAPAEDIWDPASEPCVQTRYDDYTGTDSIASFVAAVFVFTIVQTMENRRGGKPLFDFPGLRGYRKDIEGDDDVEVEFDKGVPVDVTAELGETSLTVPMALTGMDESGSTKGMSDTSKGMSDSSKMETAVPLVEKEPEDKEYAT